MNYELRFGNPTTIRTLKNFLNHPKNDDTTVYVGVDKKGVVTLGFEVPEGSDAVFNLAGDFGFQE